MKITYLGTASCFPTPTRGVSCTALQLNDGQVWLFDCGEGTQIQLQKSQVKPGKISKIFITHLHGDHLFGLPGLLCTLGNGITAKQAEEKVVNIYGPEGLRKFINTTLELSRSPLPYKHVVHELIPESDQFPANWDEWKVDHKCTSLKSLESGYNRIEKSENKDGKRFWNLIEDEIINVIAAPIKHRVPCFGYVIEEREKPGSLNVEKAKLLGVQPGPDLGRLKSGQSVIVVGSGTIVKPEDVLGPPIKGLKVVILGDTSDTSEIEAFSQNADYIVHEATMENSLKEKAIEYGHSTPQMAARFAIKVKGRKLALTHLSPRYRPISTISSAEKKDESALIILNEAKAYLEKLDACDRISVTVAEDFDEEVIDVRK